MVRFNKGIRTTHQVISKHAYWIFWICYTLPDLPAEFLEIHGFQVSKETVVLRRQERSKQKFGFIK